MKFPDMVEIPAGRFLMGAVEHDKFATASEFPVTEVEIPTPFRMSRHPITESEWFTATGGDLSKESGSQLPVVSVSSEDALAYCQVLSKSTGQTWRLPTETEWEYACRAGHREIFYTDSTIEPEVANFLFTERVQRVGPGKRTPVGSYPANDFGLGDMLGNVCEWTGSPWVDHYGADAVPDETKRIIRGGSWDYLPRLLRASWRDALTPETKRDNLGFRVVCES